MPGAHRGTEPNLRYCTYKRGNSKGGDESGLDADDLAALEGESCADDEQLKGLLSEDSGKPSASEASTSLMWRGHEIPLEIRMRGCVATAANQLAKLESPLTMSADRGLAICDKAMAYNDAKPHLRDEMAAASSVQGGSESTTRVMEIKLSDRALSVLLLEKQSSGTSSWWPLRQRSLQVKSSLRRGRKWRGLRIWFTFTIPCSETSKSSQKVDRKFCVEWKAQIKSTRACEWIAC